MQFDRKAYRQALAEEFADFQEAYRAERRKSGRRFIEARLLFNTGIILTELEKAGLIVRDGSAYKPK